MNRKTKPLIWARVINGILTAAAVTFAEIVIVARGNVPRSEGLFWITAIIVGIIVSFSCMSNDRKSVGDILNIPDFFAVIVLFSISLIFSLIFSAIIGKVCEIGIDLVGYWVLFAIITAAMLYCYIRTGYWYISYMAKGYAVLKYPSFFSKSGFICLRDFSLIIGCYYLLLDHDIGTRCANIATWFLIGIYVTGSMINLILYYTARILRDFIKITYADGQDADDAATGKPMLITADALVWDVDGSGCNAVLRGKNRVFGRDILFSADEFFIPEFAIDVLAEHFGEDINLSEFVIKILSGYVGNIHTSMWLTQDLTIMNVGSYVDACRRLLKRNSGKNGILFLSHSDWEPKKLRMMLTPEELEKIKFVRVGYNELVAP